MSLPLSVLICLVVQLCMGDQPVEEVITTKKVSLLGGWFERNPESTEVKEAAQHAVKMFNTHSKSKKMFKLVSITAAQTKVTNVINYRIDAVLGKTKCFKTEDPDLDSCSLEGKQMKCRFEVAFNHSNNTHELESQMCTKVGKKVQ
ncbi:L-cystatin [Chaetodon auriga]|uniref:L-cystatin n=1 Tax=Chaetodon auriga TaxID=39042 RepID=UPI004032F293